MSEVRTVLNQAIGNIKRKYSQEDFNPFAVMTFVYENLLHVGGGHKVLIAGHTQRFQEDIVRACHHVMSDKGHLTADMLPPKPNSFGEITTHTGTVIRFVNRVAGNHTQELALEQDFQESSYVILCSKFESPLMRNVIRATHDQKMIYDFSGNNA